MLSTPTEADREMIEARAGIADTSRPASGGFGEPLMTLLLVCLAVALAMSGWFSAAAISPHLIARWNLSASQAAALTAAVQIGFVVGALGSSLVNLPDILPPRRLMFGAAFIAALANGALLWISAYPAALLARFLTGVALAGIYPPALKLVAGWFVRSRGLAMGAVIAALTLGSALPHLLNAFTAQIAWRPVVAISSLMTFTGGMMFLFRIREGPCAAPPPQVDFRQLGAVFRNKPLMLVNIGYFGHMWELYAMWTLFGAFAAHAVPLSGSYSAALPAMLTFTTVASGAFGALLGGFMADRMGRALTTIIMLATSGSCALIIGFLVGGPLWALVLVASIWGASVIGDSAQFSTLATEIGDRRYIGTALAFQLGLGFAITTLSIQLTSFVGSRLGWHWSFLLLVPGPLVGIAAMQRLRVLGITR